MPNTATLCWQHLNSTSSMASSALSSAVSRCRPHVAGVDNVVGADLRTQTSLGSTPGPGRCVHSSFLLKCQINNAANSENEETEMNVETRHRHHCRSLEAHVEAERAPRCRRRACWEGTSCGRVARSEGK
ncbi:hypothetical protein E2C01_076751 [Portunus trituberculatus]|uniref:Uncharacterized protein n=1 Tax=Portunus trituberculatus TaxID=210409 RepID=A0A5B7IJT9_PORTR|nr:hypothetical protein [Portunus trituberculatus]